MFPSKDCTPANKNFFRRDFASRYCKQTEAGSRREPTPKPYEKDSDEIRPLGCVPNRVLSTGSSILHMGQGGICPIFARSSEDAGAEGSQLILVCPLWPLKTYFSPLLKMSRRIYQLPYCQNVIVNLASSQPLPNLS